MKPNPFYQDKLGEFINLSKKLKSQVKAAEVLKERYEIDVKADTIRVKMNKLKSKLDKEGVKVESKSETESYSEEVEIDDNRLIAYCNEKRIPISWVDSAKWVNHQGQEEFNIVLKPGFKEAAEVDFTPIIERACKKVSVKPIVIESEYLFDRFVYTDTHVGMEVNPNGHSLYSGKWDREELFRRLRVIVSEIIDNKKSNTLVIDDLGDFADGWSGETARGGHHLPQNMDNEEVFDVGIGFKCAMIHSLAEHYEKIICHNVCNSNHSGNGFDYIINKAFKEIVELKYDNVEVTNYRRFIQHYQIGEFVFVISHGKDDKNLKFGFKPKLDEKSEKKIKNYIEAYKIPTHNTIIEFSKGDSHQWMYDNSTSEVFNYYNYPALSPSSDWVKTNFQRGISGAAFFNYRSKGTKKIHEIIF